MTPKLKKNDDDSVQAQDTEVIRQSEPTCDAKEFTGAALIKFGSRIGAIYIPVLS